MSDRDNQSLPALQFTCTSKSRCCNCNGFQAKCTRSVCARAKKSCTNCHPSNHGYCQNKVTASQPLSQANLFQATEKTQSHLQIDEQQLPPCQPSCQLSVTSCSSLSEDPVNANNSTSQSPESVSAPTCTVCHRNVSLTKAEVTRMHGPTNSRSSGSHKPPATSIYQPGLF